MRAARLLAALASLNEFHDLSPVGAHSDAGAVAVPDLRGHPLPHGRTVVVLQWLPATPPRVVIRAPARWSSTSRIITSASEARISSGQKQSGHGDDLVDAAEHDQAPPWRSMPTLRLRLRTSRSSTYGW